MSLSPNKCQLDQNGLLFINIPSNEDSCYKCIGTVHTLMGWEHHSVNMNRTLLASLHATSVKATKICKGSQIKTQISFMSWIWPTSCHRIIGGIFFFSDFRAKTADSSRCFCFLCSLTCPLPPGFVLKNCNHPVDALSQFLCEYSSIFSS